MAATPAAAGRSWIAFRTDGCEFIERPRPRSCAEDQELGRGRSGVVYLTCDPTGRKLAQKVFGSSGMAKIAQYACLGAPNPYVWCESAIRCAVLRRRILAELVPFWFGNRLRVSHAYGYRWNDQHAAFEMDCELIEGRHVALHHAYTPTDHRELQDVTQKIMKPLQSHLIEFGFDGLVWQAGRGNPVALNNFMCDGRNDRGEYRWAWIDLESGIPALIPMNPLSLLTFYLPKSFRHRAPLFDNVDISKLRKCIACHRVDLEADLGGRRMRQLDENVNALALHQHNWKSLSRYECAIRYHHAKGSITNEQAAWYQTRPIRWYARESVRALRSGPRILFSLARLMLAKAAKMDLRGFLRSCWKGLCSQTYRERLARDYLDKRIACWKKRGQLNDAQCTALRGQMEKEESSTYLTDFGVHLAIKPFVKLIEFWVAPALWMAGVIDETILVAVFIGGGCVARTLYTTARLVQNAATKREKPWVALAVGVVPVVGNVAFAVQVLYSGAQQYHAMARFIMYDTFARLGQWFPIWGGTDTYTEHFLNRVPHYLLPRNASISTEEPESFNPLGRNNKDWIRSGGIGPATAE